MKTLKELKEAERLLGEKRKQKEQTEIQQALEAALGESEIRVTNIRYNSESIDVKVEFTLDGYTQDDDYYWDYDESLEEFTQKVRKCVGYIKELREQYPALCKQNDFIQTNRKFEKSFVLSHMGYERSFRFYVELADYMKLPNRTLCSAGGGDYQVKRTPERVKEYNKNIDLTVDFLIDCISELKRLKYMEGNHD